MKQTITSLQSTMSKEHRQQRGFYERHLDLSIRQDLMSKLKTMRGRSGGEYKGQERK